MLKTTRGLGTTVVGEWSLESGRFCQGRFSAVLSDRIGNAHNTPASTYTDSREKRTWLRKMFEAQLASYTPNGPNQPSAGWYYWTCELCNQIRHKSEADQQGKRNTISTLGHTAEGYGTAISQKTSQTLPPWPFLSCPAGV